MMESPRPAPGIHRFVRCAALFLVTCLTSTLALGQEGGFVTRRAYPWTPLTGSVSSTSRLVVGEFHRDGILDSAMIADGRIVVTTPHYRAAEGLNPALALTTDLAVLRASNEANQDSLFSASSDGLVRWRHEDGSWNSTVLPGAWSSVDRVLIHHVTGSGLARVLVLDRPAATIYSMFVTRNDGVVLAAAEVAAVGLSGIEDFACLDWDDDGSSELLIAHPGGLSSAELDGSDLQTLSSVQVHAMEPIGTTDDGRARVALLMRNALTPQDEWLVVLRSDGSTEAPVDLGPWSGAGSWDNAEIASGDYESDGDTDLLISERGGAILWMNSGSDQAFDGESVDIVPADAPTNYIPAIGLAEFEGELVDVLRGSVPDIDAILAFPGHTTSATVFLEVETTCFDQGALLTNLAPFGNTANPPATGSSPRSVAGPSGTPPSSPPTEFTLTLTWQIPDAVPAGVEFQVITWKQPGIITPLNYVEAEHYDEISTTVAGGQDVVLNLEFDWDGVDDNVIYYLESRLRLGARSTLVKLQAVAPSNESWIHYGTAMLPAPPGTFGPTTGAGPVVGTFQVAGAAKLRPGGSGPVDDWDPGVIFGSGSVTTVP